MTVVEEFKKKLKVRVGTNFFFLKLKPQTKKSHQNKPLALNTLINHQSSSKQRVHKQNPNQCKAKKKKTPKTKNQAPK